MDILNKAVILREYETFCYQICYYFIRDEELTVKASCEALLDLARDAEFFHGNNEVRRKKVMILAVRATLRYQSQNERKQLHSLNMKYDRP
ncbi:hypothetical protein PRECH8_26370 [Insulibacter thermoxylanivorax]|uniref:Uncharacterized protein n=1 Tax=Insulibacter thermoxylanivorax TaxID=2749268 RepID=A0A916QEL2_9BACL|nr:hypothetical protein [Insulibacter thermoxylanivorax]GFR39341.1 hypothetical protein PRECH8_26370 [Insulibacter thermoxylanivorax]